MSCCITAAPAKCPIDVAIVLDESGSIGGIHFNLTKSFLSQLVGYLDIDSGNTRVGLVTYSTSVTTRFNPNAHSSVTSVQSAISSVTYSGGGYTNTHLALGHVRTSVMTSAAGDRNNVPNVVVLLTDGQSSNPTSTRVSSQHTCSITSYKLTIIVSQC